MRHKPKHYAAALYHATAGLSGKKLDDVINAFVALLVADSRTSSLSRICTEFIRYANAVEHTATAEVVSAHPLSKTDRVNLLEQLQVRTGKIITLTEQVDPAILGGFRVQIDDTLIDASVAGSLEQLRSRMQAV